MLIDAFKNSQEQLLKTVKLTGITNYEELLYPKRIIQSTLKVGDKFYQSYRVQYNNNLGPFKGGIRYHPSVCLSEVKALSFWMSIKCSLANIPFGGGKGGVVVNPKNLEKSEIIELSKEYARAFSDVIGPYKDIPAPDVYTNSEIMDVIRKEFEKIKGKKSPGVITGKSVSKDGSLGRGVSTSLGGFYVLNTLNELLKIKTNNLNFSIEGFGNAGMNFAKFIIEKGYKLISVSDSKGIAYFKQGFDLNKLIEIKKQGSVINYPNCEIISKKQFLGKKVDVLVLAALENSITKETASIVKANIILELANGPITSKADEILNKNKTLIIPDVLANSGGVIVSYYEWVQNNENQKWSEEKVFVKLKNLIIKNTRKVFENSQSKKITLRQSSFDLAVRKILNSKKNSF